jgi:hypothetical protein
MLKIKGRGLSSTGFPPTTFQKTTIFMREFVLNIEVQKAEYFESSKSPSVEF